MFDLKNKKITVMGLGSRGGVGVVKFLVEKGAKVTVTDLKKAEDLPLDDLCDLDIEFTLGRHEEGDFRDADLVIRNPAVPSHNEFLQIARGVGIPIWMESTLFFAFCPSRKIIGVTGTKGKTTTATLIAEILRRAGKEVVLAGNMGISMLAELPKINPQTFVVLELSSFQLEGLAPIKRSPWIAVITNIYPDHLNYYKSFPDYASAKREIYRYQTPQDLLLFSKDGGDAFEIGRKVGKVLGIAEGKIEEAISAFETLPHRLEKVAVKNGVPFFNDSCATNPHAAVYSIERVRSLHGKPVLITGGMDKNLDYRILAEKINKEGIKTALLEGSATKKLAPLLKRHLIIGRFADLASAVEGAFASSGGKKAVLFSPASASFEMFEDEFDRGEKFKEIVKNL